MTRIKFIHKIFLALCLFFVLAGVFTAKAVAAPRFYFDPASFTSTQNNDFQVNVKIDVENQAASGADAVLTFPSGDITVKAVSNGGFFTDFTNSPAASGKVELHGYFSALYASRTGSGTFATLTLSSNKGSGSGIIGFTCSGNETDILDSNGTNILACTALTTLNVNYSGGVAPGSTPGPTNACGGTCGSNGNCNAGLFCNAGYCRNPDCPNSNTCGCTAPTPTPRSTPKPTLKPGAVATPTPKATPVALTKFTPFPKSTPEASPEATPEPTKQGINLKLIATGIAGFALFLALILILVTILRKRNRKPPMINPPTGLSDSTPYKPPEVIMPTELPVSPPDQINLKPPSFS